jgi:hypothetical protein
MNNRDFGTQGEDIACEYLSKNGYEIIERNKYFSKLCEIDIIAKIKDTIVFKRFLQNLFFVYRCGLETPFDENIIENKLLKKPRLAISLKIN